MNGARFIIGVPTFKRPSLLGDLLDTLTAQEDIVQCVVFIVDNDPQRSAEDVVAERRDGLALEYACENEPGVVHVRNRILKAAHEGGFEAVIFLDDDERPESDWLRSLLEGYETFPSDVLAGRVKYLFDSEQADPFVEEFYERKSRPKQAGLLTASGTGNTLIPVSVLVAAGYPQFDPRYSAMGGEDSDYFRRLKGAGIRMRAWPAAVVTEVVPRERAARQWIIRRSIRSGYIRGTIARTRFNRGRVVIGSIARLGLGSALLLGGLLKDRRLRHSHLATFLSGYGMLQSLYRKPPSAYGDEGSDG